MSLQTPKTHVDNKTLNLPWPSFSYSCTYMVQDLDHEPVTRIEDERVAADHEQDGMGTKSFRSMDISL